jgi:hypothetical protein
LSVIYLRALVGKRRALIRAKPTAVKLLLLLLSCKKNGIKGTHRKYPDFEQNVSIQSHQMRLSPHFNFLINNNSYAQKSSWIKNLTHQQKE